MTYFLHYFSVSSTVTIVSVDVDYYTCLYQMILTLDMYPRESYAEVLTTKKMFHWRLYGNGFPCESSDLNQRTKLLNCVFIINRPILIKWLWLVIAANCEKILQYGIFILLVCMTLGVIIWTNLYLVEDDVIF
jgi:hypothetical protein